MYVLGIDTTGNIGSVGLLSLSTGDIRMNENSEPMSHLKNMASLVERAIKGEGIDKKSISHVAVSAGPGSFTGIRIGVTMGRAIAQALDIPTVSVPTLETFGERVPEMATGVCGIINARRGQVYSVIFDKTYNPEEGLPGGGVLLAPGPYMLEEVLEITDKHEDIRFYGDGVDAYKARLEEGPVRFFAPPETRYQSVDLVLKIAARKIERGETVSYSRLLPDYMRLAEAEQKLKDGTLEKMRQEKLERIKRSMEVHV